MDSFESLESLDVDSQGNIYVADYGNDRIQKFDTQGNFLLKWGTLGNAVGQFDGHAGVALDSSDNVYVADVNSHRIQKFSGNGEFISSFGNEGEGDGQFIEPKGIDVNSGNIYVADTGNFMILVFSQE